MLVDPARGYDLAGRNELIGVAESLAARTLRRVLLHLLKCSERRLDDKNPEREDDEDCSQFRDANLRRRAGQAEARIKGSHID